MKKQLGEKFRELGMQKDTHFSQTALQTYVPEDESRTGSVSK